MKTRCRACKRWASTRRPCKACMDQRHLSHVHDDGTVHAHVYVDPHHQHLAGKGQSWVA